MPPWRITQLVTAAAALVMVLVNLGMHEGPGKDWLTILLGVVVVALGVTSLVPRRQESRRDGRSH